MSVIKEHPIRQDPRGIDQEAAGSIQNIYDAIVELVTNSDDHYQFHFAHVHTSAAPGTIEIEIERHRGESMSLIRVRDFGKGITLDEMDDKLGQRGGRVSGFEKGAAVRGTNSRGAKDIARLGGVVFESMAQDGKYHKYEITRNFICKLHSSAEPSEKVRRRLHIRNGTGTVVTLRVDGSYPIPQHDSLLRDAARLVPLRDILSDPCRRVVLRDSTQQREHVLKAPRCEGKERVSQTLSIPDYPDVKAKLVIVRAKKQFEARQRARFRLGGILVKSRHAVHEATLFDNVLDGDPHALWFCGKLSCEYIDDLWNDFDTRFATDRERDPRNQTPIVDPARRGGLSREHTFTKVLYGEALKRLRPLVEEERRQAEKQRVQVENKATRRFLDQMEKAALNFLTEKGGDEEDEPVDSHRTQQGGRLGERGYILSPPYSQLVVGESCKHTLSVRQSKFPELESGASVQVECLSKDITSSHRFASLVAHPTQDDVLIASWKVKAVTATPATGLRVRVPPITAESHLEVFASESDRYADIRSLQFERKLYRVRTDRRRRRVRLLAPLDMVSKPTPFELKIKGRRFSSHGERVLKPNTRRGVAVCDFTIKTTHEEEANAQLEASIGLYQANVDLIAVLPPGVGLRFDLEDVDYKNQRYRWKGNHLEIAARHPSLHRYLGPSSAGFPGQEKPHFRVLLAEIIADAVCTRALNQYERDNPTEFHDVDWNVYYAEFSELMTQFLPRAHKYAILDSQLKQVGA